MDVTRPRTVDTRREEALRGLVTAATARPVDLEQVTQARQLVLKEQNEATLVEAAAVLAYKDFVTKITDASGKPPAPALMWSILRTVFAILRFFFETWQKIFGGRS